MSVASATLFSTGASDIGAPTRRISPNRRRSKRMPLSDKATDVRPEARYQASIVDEAMKEITVARPAPVMPSAGIGPTPNTSAGTSAICRISAAT